MPCWKSSKSKSYDTKSKSKPSSTPNTSENRNGNVTNESIREPKQTQNAINGK